MSSIGNTGREYSRRRWLQAIGAVGAASLAGCSGDDDGPDADPGVEGDDSDDAGDDGRSDEGGRLNVIQGGVHFPDLQWNQFGDQHNGTIKHFVDMLSAFTRDADNELTGYGYTDWEYDPDERLLTTELRDDVTFWNGEEYTADDLYTFQEILRLQNPDASPFESIEVTDDYTIEYVTEDALNPQILYRTQVTEVWFEYGETVWGEWLERFEDAADQEERDEVSAELAEWSIPTEQFIDEGLGTGAYMLDTVTDEYMDLVAYEDHPLHAGNDDRFDPNIEEIRIIYSDETGRSEQLVVNERVDYAGHNVGSWDAFRDQMPDHWDRIVHAPTGNMYKMLINWRNREYLQDVNFRRAMAAALDYENHATNTEQFPLEDHTGMSVAHNGEYWGEDNPSEFIQYGLNSDLDLADEYLSRSGYERDDDAIYDEDGEELEEMRFYVGGGIWGQVAQTVAQELQQYGFPIDIRPVDRTTKLEIIQNDMGSWDLSTETHFAGTTNHAYEFYDPGTFWGWRIGPGGFGPEPEFDSQVQEWLDNGETHSPYTGKPMVFEVPEEVGSEELDGETKELDLYELTNEIQTPVDEERDHEIVRDLSWAWNFLLPDIDITYAVADTFGNTEKIEFGAEEDLQSYNAQRWPEFGLVRLRE